MKPHSEEVDANNPAQGDCAQETSDLRDNTFDAYIVIDADSRILEWSTQAARLFGWSQEEALGLRLTDTIIPRQHHHARVVAGAQG